MENLTLAPDQAFATSPTAEEGGDDWTAVRVQGDANDKQRPKTRLGLPIFTLATDRAPESCVVIVAMRSLRF